MARQRWQPTPRRIDVLAPAVGLDWAQVNDSGGLWLVRGLVAQLVTSAVAGNREVAVSATDGTSNWYRTTAGQVSAANSTRLYSAFPGSEASTLASVTRTLAWPTDGLLLPSGHVLSSVTTGLDAGDQWSAVVLDVIEYPETLPTRLIPGPLTYEQNDQE